MKKNTKFLTIFAMGLLAGPMVVQADFNYELVDHPDADDTQVFGINDRGDVVGNGIDEDAGPFVFASKKGEFTDVPADADIGVLGLNDAGVIGSPI